MNQTNRKPTLLFGRGVEFLLSCDQPGLDEQLHCIRSGLHEKRQIFAFCCGERLEHITCGIGATRGTSDADPNPVEVFSAQSLGDIA